MSFNKVILVGNLGRDPELRYTPQGTPVCNFSMATSEKRKDSAGEVHETTTWFKVTLFGRQAETAAQYLAKGMPLYIEGRLKLSEWTDKEGKTRTTLEVTATEMQFIGSDMGERSQAATANGGSAPAHEEPNDDDIPF